MIFHCLPFPSEWISPSPINITDLMEGRRDLQSDGQVSVRSLIYRSSQPSLNLLPTLRQTTSVQMCGPHQNRKRKKWEIFLIAIIFLMRSTSSSFSSFFWSRVDVSWNLWVMLSLTRLKHECLNSIRAHIRVWMCFPLAFYAIQKMEKYKKFFSKRTNMRRGKEFFMTLSYSYSLTLWCDCFISLFSPSAIDC